MRPALRTIITCLLALGAPALAEEPSSAAQEDARRLFLAGRQAYQEGRLEVAASSFEAAYRITPLAALLFNLAQVYRKQYLVDQDARRLRQAVDNYRRYLKEAPTGPNREAATQALVELTPVMARVFPNALNTTASSPILGTAPTRTEIMVVTEAAEARVALDGKPPAPAPLLAEATPGEHRAVVEAPGFFPEELKVTAVDGRLVTTEARLRPRPGQLAIRSRSGASLYVDGRVSGKAPVDSLEVPAGKHVLGISSRGHVPWAQEVEVPRGGTTKVQVDLAPTAQRRSVLWVGLATGLVAAAAGVLGGMWYRSDQIASDLNQRRMTSGLTIQELAEYNAERTRRDQWQAATIAAGSLAGLFGLVTLGLYLFDHQEPPRLTPSGTGGAQAVFSF